MTSPFSSSACRSAVPALGLACSLAWGAFGSGCKSTGVAALRPAVDEHIDVSDVRGPTERRLQGVSWEERRERLRASGVPMEGLAEFEAAQRFYDAGEYRAAENAFKALARQRSRAGKTWQTRWQEIFAREKASADLYGGYGDPIEEDALFMVAESQFAQKKYSWAQDSYGSLLEKYPSTRHLDSITRRLFFVAQYWLDVPTVPAETNDVQLVDHQTDGTEAPSIEVRTGPATWPVVPNIADRTRPVFDTHGRALQALESIWRHDAAGPLADDSLMLQATYYQQKGDYVEAARLYALVREQYPDSQHFQDAFLLGSHVTLASYTGPEYDGTTLHQARDLKRTARQMFVNLTDEQKQRLDSELARIQEAEVERLWEKVEFYRWKSQPASVALYCNQIINNHPDSSYADRAREMLQSQQVQNARSEPTLLSEGRAESAPAPGTFGSLPVESEEPNDADRPGFFQRLLRRPEKPPDLRPVEPESNDSEGSEPPARIAL